MKKRIFLFPLLLLMITIFSCKDKTKEQSKLEYSKYISDLHRNDKILRPDLCSVGK